MRELNSNVTACSARAQENTDAGNRDRFVSAYKDELCFIVETKQWLEKRETVWAPATQGSLQERALRITHQIEEYANYIEDPNIKAATLSWVRQSQSCSRLNAMISMAAKWPEMEVHKGDFDAATHLLAAKNEIVELFTENHSRDNSDTLWTRRANAVWDQSADCPNFKTFLNQIFCGDQELIDWVHRALGYSITGSTDEQVMFIALGAGSNGKSTLLEVIMDVMGDYARSMNINELMKKDHYGIRSLEQIAVLDGIRLSIASEVESGGRLNEAIVKRLTGGDTLTAARLHQSQFVFTPQFKIWMLVNSLPMSEDVSHGFWRRVCVVPFNARFEGEQRQIDIKKLLLKERNGILKWLIEGAKKWHAEHKRLGGSGLAFCEAVRDATDTYKDKCDPVKMYIAACTTKSLGAETSAQVLFDAYQGWCRDGYGISPVNQTVFSKLLMSNGFERKRKRDGYVYLGLKLK